MRVFGKFLAVLGLVVLTALPVAQAAEGTDKAAEQQAMQDLSAKIPSSQQNSSYACPIAPGSGAGASAGGNTQNVVTAAASILSPEKMREMTKKWRTSTKNLPPGNYRERCFGCLTQPDEDGERVLNCVCPVKDGVQRITVSLEKCKEGEEITYCAGMLVCGKCMYTDASAADNGLSRAMSEKTKQETDTILKIIGKGAP